MRNSVHMKHLPACNGNMVRILAQYQVRSLAKAFISMYSMREVRPPTFSASDTKPRVAFRVSACYKKKKKKAFTNHSYFILVLVLSL